MNNSATIRTVHRVLDLDTGDEVLASHFFLKPESEIWKFRLYQEEAIRGSKSAKFVCYFCGQHLKIRGNSQNQILHFAHLKDSEDCPIKTGQNFSEEEILRVKYNGKKESQLHKDLKNTIAELLELNKSETKGITSVEIEQRHKSILNFTDWRQPDVSSIYKNKKLVFEIQLSTTFLSVIVARELFYQNNQTFILWIFKQFERQRFTEKDIFYSNNRNAFVLNDEAIERSKVEKDLVILCHYQKPILEIKNKVIYFVWESEFVKLSDLTFDEKTFKVFYFDVEKEIKKKLELLNSIKSLNELTSRTSLQKPSLREVQIEEEYNTFKKQIVGQNLNPTDLQKLFLDFPISELNWEVTRLYLSGYTTSQADKDIIFKEFKLILDRTPFYPRGLVENLAWVIFHIKVEKIPYNRHNHIHAIRPLLYTILSFKKKKMIGTDQNSWLRLAHTVKLENFQIFLKAIELFQGLDKFCSSDKKGKFIKKIEKYRNEKPKQDLESERMVKIIFRELI